jgi:hypothetical protein
MAALGRTYGVNPSAVAYWKKKLGKNVKLASKGGLVNG